MRALLSLLQVVARAAEHNLTAMLHKSPQESLARFSVFGRPLTRGYVVYAERCLQRGELEKLVEYDFSVGIPLDVDHTMLILPRADMSDTSAIPSIFFLVGKLVDALHQI